MRGRAVAGHFSDVSGGHPALGWDSFLCRLITVYLGCIVRTRWRESIFVQIARTDVSTDIGVLCASIAC